MGWFDPDRKTPAQAKLQVALTRYEQRFGRRPTYCLTSLRDAAELGDDTGVHVEGRRYIARNVFYVGQAEDADPSVMEASQ